MAMRFLTQVRSISNNGNEVSGFKVSKGTQAFQCSLVPVCGQYLLRGSTPLFGLESGDYRKDSVQKSQVWCSLGVVANAILAINTRAMPLRYTYFGPYSSKPAR